MRLLALVKTTHSTAMRSKYSNVNNKEGKVWPIINCKITRQEVKNKFQGHITFKKCLLKVFAKCVYENIAK